MSIVQTNEIIEKLNLRSAAPEYAFKNIINIDNDDDLGYLFYDCFYITNHKIDKLENRMIKILHKNNMFKIIHGYSKSGKTTFINSVIHKNNTGGFNDGLSKGMIFPVHFDFEKGEDVTDYIGKIKYFYETMFRHTTEKEKRKEINKLIDQFSSFINDFRNELSLNNKSDQAHIVENTFSDIIYYFQQHLIKTEYGKISDEFLIRQSFKKYITDNITLKNCHTFFTYLVFFKIFNKRKEIFNKDKHKIVIIIDNIDENLQNEDVTFLKQPQIDFSSFLHQLFRKGVISKIFNKSLFKNIAKSDSMPNIIYSEQLKVVYIFRTANYLVFANLIQNENIKAPPLAEKHFQRLMLDEEVIHYRSIGNITGIFNLRLARFKEVADHLNYAPPKGYLFFKTLSDNYSYSEETSIDTGEFDWKRYSDFNNDIRRIFNLWNGDNIEFWNSITEGFTKIQNKYGEHENIIKKLDNIDTGGITVELYRGIYIHLFVCLLKKRSSNNKVLYHAIDIFRDPKNGKLKNINRLVINSIINATYKNGRANAINDIQFKGIGLYDLLSDLKEFVDTINKLNPIKPEYDFKDIKKYFKDLCIPKIHSYEHLFLIYKNQTLVNENDVIVNSNFYTLDEEINRFEEEGNSSKQDLNKIRLFHNNNAAFISAELLTEFELYSYTLNEKKEDGKIDLPLLFLLERKKDIKIVKTDEDFEFREIISSVYHNTKITMDNMVSFYIEKLIHAYPPEVFDVNPFFTVINPISKKGEFQFKQTISRHVRYLRNFRQVVLKFSDTILGLHYDEKVIANIFLKGVIAKYCTLYIDNYNKINQESKIEKDSSLYRAKSFFDSLKKEIESLKDGDFNEFFK